MKTVVNDELGGMWKEAEVEYCGAIYYILLLELD
jgi:hypothetical protein